MLSLKKDRDICRERIASLNLKISTQTVGLKITKIIAVNKPIIPPKKAPLVR